MLVTYKEFGVARLFLNVPTLKPDSNERFLVKLKGCQQNFKERMYRVFIRWKLAQKGSHCSGYVRGTLHNMKDLNAISCLTKYTSEFKLF